MSDTVQINVIESEVIAAMKSGHLHPDQIIVLSSIVFADGEGIARMPKDQLRRWCALPGQRRSTTGFIRARIAGLVTAGVLAQGSTPTELRSMIAYANEEERK